VLRCGTMIPMSSTSPSLVSARPATMEPEPRQPPPQRHVRKNFLDLTQEPGIFQRLQHDLSKQKINYLN
jgi:hypothetical protein